MSRQLVGSLARSAAVALHRAGGSSQRPTAWATPVVVSSSVAPKACRVHGMAGVDYGHGHGHGYDHGHGHGHGYGYG